MGLTRRSGLLLALLLVLSLLPFSAADAGTTDRPPLEMVKAPSVSGVNRFGHTLEADRGRWRPTPTHADYQWLRDGEPIRDADRFRYELQPRDVDHRIAVSVTVYAPEHRATSRRVVVGRALHRVPVRRTVHYSVRAKGHITASMSRFRSVAQQVYDDPRGWRGAGVRFVRVPKGGSFTLWLSEARLVPTFSSECSAMWSCRVGRNVIINQTRWLHASPAWNAGSLGRLAYRNMVVNHETGHWLGFHHATCPRRGAPAPVMMQQSKGTGGCRFNPFPTLAELHRVHNPRLQARPAVAVD
ncbi:DUF3152 domain-containing protein [Nocardioides panacisoli]|uniref:DUF3152 domain-containing protein n=1 Tax=Nocardioides panacisoli TaxID=627624 RepID=A0ABP7I4Q4_9ACTN